MVGFIAEGASERLILESESFRDFLKKNQLHFVTSVIDATGNCNQLPHRRAEAVNILKDKGASIIIILTDKDHEPCITTVKNRILPGKDELVIVSVSQLEAWFLADTVAMRKFLNSTTFECEYPEAFIRPIDEIKKLRLSQSGRGVSDKIILTRLMLQSGFSVERAASHTNCKSAGYFIEKLKSLTTQ
ncbi:MAG: hypothetical protein IM638_11135 [Bacteroidetes bacterium]|nr:hypothetical protein [Bacteroidota bacterium]